MALTLDRICKTLERRKQPLAAYCFSEQCAESPWGNKPRRLKSVRKGDVWCPKCGCAIYWQLGDDRLRKVDKP